MINAYKKLALGLGLLAVIAAPAVIPVVALAGILPDAIATWHVAYSDTPIMRKVIISNPELHKDNVAFQIFNNSPTALHFPHPDGTKYYIPVLSQKTVTVPYQKEAQYTLEDGAGNVVYSFGITDDSVKTAVAGAPQSVYDGWTKQLQDVIAANQVPVIPEYKQEDKEPTYTPVYHAPKKHSKAVRGYY